MNFITILMNDDCNDDDVAHEEDNGDVVQIKIVFAVHNIEL